SRSGLRQRRAFCQTPLATSRNGITDPSMRAEEGNQTGRRFRTLHKIWAALSLRCCRKVPAFCGRPPGAFHQVPNETTRPLVQLAMAAGRVWTQCPKSVALVRTVVPKLVAAVRAVVPKLVVLVRAVVPKLVAFVPAQVRKSVNLARALVVAVRTEVLTLVL